MGRSKAKRAERDRRRTQHSRECGLPDVTLHAVTNMDEAMAALFGPGPASDDWRQDVLGRKRLSVRLGPDGGLTINGHPLTPEMCTELQAERPEEAAVFAYDEFMRMRRGMVPGLEMCRPAPK